ncbi:hypothetical protein CHH72_19650 [Shouchella clausii]|uniref:Uncharacterized protein n=1 Tax=Shouchella clausii TaxID=79880 RepID=A0A268NVE2_SHOCL|nr:hypothetical protein CHH72_19650 [Shouchella clausii]
MVLYGNIVGRGASDLWEAYIIIVRYLGINKVIKSQMQEKLSSPINIKSYICMVNAQKLKENVAKQ